MISRDVILSIAKELDVPAGGVYGFVITESNGAFSWGGGKIPILFERHVCYREVKRKFGYFKARQLFKAYPDICNPKSGGYGPSATQYNRLAKAISRIDKEIAHLSASFGAFQIMGFNHRLAGYSSAVLMSDAFHADPENNQVRGFVEFLKNYKRGGVIAALRCRDWVAAAKAYNGKRYYINSYDKKIKTAAHAWDVGKAKVY